MLGVRGLRPLKQCKRCKRCRRVRGLRPLRCWAMSAECWAGVRGLGPLVRDARTYPPPTASTSLAEAPALRKSTSPPHSEGGRTSADACACAGSGPAGAPSAPRSHVATERTCRPCARVGVSTRGSDLWQAYFFQRANRRFAAARRTTRSVLIEGPFRSRVSAPWE